MRALFSLICLCIFMAVQAIPSINGPLDIKKLKRVLDDGLKSTDISTLYYAVKGYQLIKEAVPNSKEICDILKTSKYNTLSIEPIYYSIAMTISLSCKDIPPPSILTTAVNVMNTEDASLSDIHYSILTMAALGKNHHDNNMATKHFTELLKKDDSVLSLSLAIHICSEIGCANWASERLEDLMLQADEVNGRLLQWDGGLSVTSSALTALLRVATLTKKPPPITLDQAVKFGNYLLSRNTVQTVKGAAQLLETAYALSQNAAISPVSISIKGNKFVSGETDRVLIFVSDILGNPLKSLKAESVIAQSATRLIDDVVVLSKQPLIAHPTEKAVFIFDLLKVKPEKGLYKLALSAGSSTSSLTVRVLGEISIDNVEIGLTDIDGISSKKMIPVRYPGKTPQSLSADNLQKLIIKFIIKDKSQNQPTAVHQAFVRFWNKETQEEYIIVAEQDSSKTYKMDVDVVTFAEAFTDGNGNFGIELIIGDSVIVNPIRWHLTDLTLKIPHSFERKEKLQTHRDIRPHIDHLFRKPEPRPPRVLSDAFTALCTAPFLLLLILWYRIGINVSNFPFVLSAIVFHIGLGSILGLFVVFWLQLTMFETIRYLLGLGFITFISGHRLLRHIVSQKKSS